MRRLVYAPYVQAFIKTSTDQVVDISPYLVSGSIDRKVNQVSSAQLTLRNPVVRDGAPGITHTRDRGEAANLLFTEFQHQDGTVGPLFHPMDPIIIVMQRIQNYPIHMFTGYLDLAPYIQLYPGLCSIEASCTLKRLLYTQWDAALPFVIYFLEQYGWVLNAENGIANPSAETSRLGVTRSSVKSEAAKIQGQFNDGSLGALLFAVLEHMGQWDPNTIYIEALPPQIKNIVLNLYQETSREAQQGNQVFQSLLTEILGQTSHGTGAPGTPGNLPANIDQNNWAQATLIGIGAPVSDCNVKALEYWAQQEGGLPNNNPLNTSLGLSSGNWHYPDLHTGVVNTVKTLLESHYTYIVAAFRANGGLKAIWTALNSGNTGANQCWCCSGCGANYPGVLFSNLNAPCTTSLTSPTVNSTGQGNKSAQRHRFGQGVTGTSPTATHNTTIQRASTASAAGKSPGGKVGKALATGGNAGSALLPNANSVINPIPGFSGFTYDYGIDASAPPGAAVLAPADCTVAQWIPNFYKQASDGSGGLLLLQFDQRLLQAPTQYWYISEHVLMTSTTVGHKFRQGDMVANFGGQGGGNGIEIGWGVAPTGDPRYGASLGIVDHTSGVWGQDFKNYFSIGGGKAVLGRVGGGGAGSGSGSTSAVAAAFSTFINLPSTFSMAEALAFTGKRSFIADQPLFPFIEQLCQASLRNFMSMPNGNFFAFFPDYFGLFGRKYYWEIADIEIIDGRIDLSDDPLVTHVAVAGDVTQYHGQIDVFDLILTSGIFDIFDAFATGYIASSASSVTGVHVPTTVSKTPTKAGTKTAKTDPAPVSKQDALAFLQRYGARPYVEEAPMIRSPFFELFLAFQRFMLLWSKQFVTTFELTFMPEVFPGGLILLRDHGLQLYVEEVTHNFDYEHGFTTTIAVSSPSRPGASLANSPQLKSTNPSAGPTILITPPQGNTQVGHR